MKPVQMETTEGDPMELALSTDVVMDNVLSCLKVTDLLSCRQVSKFWNGAASSVLRKRSTMTKLINNKNLMNLAECIKLSSDFPFAGLQLHRPWRFNSGYAKEFFQNYGDRFTRLRLKMCWRTLNGLAPFITYLPRVWILEVRGRNQGPWHAELLDIVARQKYGVIFKLPSVRIIRILPCDEVNGDILREVLTAASPSVQIECLDAKPETLRVLSNCGKLQAISFLKFNADQSEYRSKVPETDAFFSIESPLLSKLEFNIDGCLSLGGLEKLLVSSQHTLNELHLEGHLWCNGYSCENLLVLAKLTKLSLNPELLREFLFRGRLGNIFPALKEVHLHEGYGLVKCDVSLFIVPSVRRIELEGHVDKDGMKQLAQSFPNVTDVRLNYSSYDVNVPHLRRRPFEIWSVGKFKRLEKLRIWNVPVRQPTKVYLSMDSILTGIPVEICKNLHETKQVALIGSPHHEVVRNNPSILQLENLKELIVCVERGCKKAPEVSPFITMVSVRYALDMMPNLRTKFVFEHSHIEELDKAMLEAAFKHVQPSIKLEPFFY